MQTIIKRSPLVVVFFTLFLTLPITSNTPFYWFFYGFSLLILLPLLIFFTDKNRSFSLLQQLKTYHPVLYYLLVAFAISSLISWVNVLVSDVGLQHKIISTQRYLNCWLLVFYVFMMSRFALFQHISHTRLFSLIAYGCLLLAGLLLFSYFSTDKAFALAWWNAPPFGSHIRVIGMMLLTACVACIASVLFTPTSKLQTSLALFVLFICATFLFWSGGRIGILAMLITFGCLAATVMLWQKHNINAIFLIVLTLVLAVITAEACAVFPWNSFGRIGAISHLAVQQHDTVASLDKLGNGRIDMWIRALNDLLHAPFFGFGPSGYLLVNRPEGVDHTHNFIIECLVEWGLIGTILMLGIFSYFAHVAVKRLKPAIVNNDINWITAAAVVFALTINSMADGIYFILLPCFVVLTGFTKFPFFTERYVQTIRKQYAP